MMDDYAQLEGVRIATDGAAEMDRNRRIIFVAREKIVRLELRRGPAAERPVVTTVIGLLLFGLALAGGLWVILGLASDAIFPKSAIAAVFLVIRGWWLIDLSLRPRWFVLVHEQSGTRKLVFHRTRDAQTIQRFLLDAKTRFGYT